MQGQTTFVPQQQFAPTPYPDDNVFGHGAEPQSILGKRCREAVVNSHCEPNPSAGNGAAPTAPIGAVRIVPGPGPQTNGCQPMSGMEMGMNMPMSGMPMTHGPGLFDGIKDGGMSLMNRSAGLEFAKLKKEEAREGFKEKRRMELVSIGEGDRTKRRRKNDTSMSENQKYRRRLKMNQDSAAAARYAQEMYVVTLEDLVQKFEMEKNRMSGDIGSLRNETFQMQQKIAMLQVQLAQKRADKQKSKVAKQNAVQQGIPQNHCVQPTGPVAMQTPPRQVSEPSTYAPPCAPVAPSVPQSMDTCGAPSSVTSKASESAGMSEFSTLSSNNDGKSTDMGGNDEIEFQSDMKKLGDMYDPSFMLSLGLDENLDFSNDIIDMHPIA